MLLLSSVLNSEEHGAWGMGHGERRRVAGKGCAEYGNSVSKVFSLASKVSYLMMALHHEIVNPIFFSFERIP